MNCITIPRVDTIDSAADIPQAMISHKTPYHKVETVNWPDSYPYCPSVEVALAHDGQSLFVHYRVSEQSVRAMAEHDNGPVWEDSCCELFLMPDVADGIYYNIECNCAGTLLIGEGTGRNARTHASREVLDKVERWSSFPLKAVFEEKRMEGEWQLALRIPSTCLFKHHITDLSGMQMRINVYKCGDALKTPHFLSLFPIDHPKPNFHLPEFFKEVLFE